MEGQLKYMAETTYTYLITDTANDKVDAGKLKNEISSTSTITISLNRIDTDSDEIFCVFNDALPEDSIDNQVEILTGLINAHDGVSSITIQPVRIQETSLADRVLTVKGLRFVADLNTTTEEDVSFAEERELQNVGVFVENHTSGDYMEMFAVHPNPAIGVIRQFGETVYIPSTGEITPDESLDTSIIPAGLLLRFVYHSVATTGDQPIVIVHLRTHK